MFYLFFFYLVCWDVAGCVRGGGRVVFVVDLSALICISINIWLQVVHLPASFLFPFLIWCFWICSGRNMRCRWLMMVFLCLFGFFRNWGTALLLNFCVLEMFDFYLSLLSWHSLSFTFGWMPSRFWNVSFLILCIIWNLAPFILLLLFLSCPLSFGC